MNRLRYNTDCDQNIGVPLLSVLTNYKM